MPCPSRGLLFALTLLTARLPASLVPKAQCWCIFGGPERILSMPRQSYAHKIAPIKSLLALFMNLFGARSTLF